VKHGAQNPASALKKIQTSIAKLKNATSASDPKLDFVKGFTYTNVSAGDLTDFGRREMWYMGKRYAEEYEKVAGGPFVRARSDRRIVESGEFFLQGFRGRSSVSLRRSRTSMS